MNFEFNKIAGAVLGTALGVMVVGLVAEAIYAPRSSEQPGFVIAVAEPGEGGGEAPAAPAVLPIADRLQAANAKDGAKDVAKCKTCHTFEQGGPNKVGPNLWDVVGHNVIHGDFEYSDAMEEKGQAGLEWTFENLDHFIENPKGFIPGTAMSFAGVKNPQERADIIAYLRTLSDNPVALPPPTPAPTAEAPAETPPATGENPPAATESPPAETPAPAPEAPPSEAPAPPATEQPAAPVTEQPAPTTPDAEAESPEGAPEPEAAPPAETPAPAVEQPAPTTPDAEAESPEGAPEPEAVSPAETAPAPAVTPDTEAESPEGAPAPEQPAQ